MARQAHRCIREFLPAQQNTGISRTARIHTTTLSDLVTSHGQGLRQGHRQPEMTELLRATRVGSTMVVHSMGRPAGTLHGLHVLPDLRRIRRSLTTGVA